MNSPPHLPHPCHLHPLPPTHLPSPQGGNAADQPRLRTALAAASVPAMINATLEFMLTPQCKLQVGAGKGLGRGGSVIFRCHYPRRSSRSAPPRPPSPPSEPVGMWGKDIHPFPSPPGCGGMTFNYSPSPPPTPPGCGQPAGRHGDAGWPAVLLGVGLPAAWRHGQGVAALLGRRRGVQPRQGPRQDAGPGPGRADGW